VGGFRSFVVLSILGLVVFLAPLSPAATRGQIARGKYLVEQVGMCADCHSPRDEKGAFVRERWLRGSKLDFQPVHPIPNFATEAPEIAGLPDWNDADAVKLLSTGLAPGGQPLRPPMPMYKLTVADARAVVAYLRSLAPSAK